MESAFPSGSFLAIPFVSLLRGHVDLTVKSTTAIASRDSGDLCNDGRSSWVVDFYLYSSKSMKKPPPGTGRNQAETARGRPDKWRLCENFQKAHEIFVELLLGIRKAVPSRCRGLPLYYVLDLHFSVDSALEV